MKSSTSASKKRTSSGTSVKRKAASRKGRPAQREAALEVLKKFRQVFRAAKVHFNAIEKRAGVTGAQLWALCELEEQPGVRVTDLAAAMALHQSTVSNLIDKLLRKRLIRRDRGDIDGRVVRLYLTAAGERIVRSAPTPGRGVLPDALEHLPPTALRGLDQQLGNLLRRMRVKAPNGSMMHIQEI
jgi:DNA-binding MarR family transcriptional regulator